MRLLDLFCCQGGAAEGYHRAGFDEIVGVDITPQPRYPFTFVQADAVEFVKNHGHEFDAIHASPPCQSHSSLRSLQPGKEHPDFLPQTREALQNLGKPYIIENVVGAPMVNPLILCGTMFGLGTVCKDGVYRELRRHRQFESSIALFVPEHPKHSRFTVGVYGNGGGSCARGYSANAEEAGAALGINWMTKAGMSQSIPPAYTEYLGRFLLDAVR